MPKESTSLVNLGDLTKPATILVEKICNAVGKIYEPTYKYTNQLISLKSQKLKLKPKLLKQKAILKL
jgi:hypothetical protein